MKSILFILFLSVSVFSSAQNSKSIFGDSATTWDIIIAGYCDAVCKSQFNATGDTIVDGKKYTVIPFYDGFVREDTTSGKVWFYNKIYAQEYLVMDLNLNLNEAFTIYSYNNTPSTIFVDSIYYINGLKHVRLNHLIRMCALEEKLTFIEGSGPNAAFHYQRSDIASYMLCHFKDGVKVAGNIIFNNDCDICDVGINEYHQNNIYLFPNPSRDVFHFRFPHAEKALHTEIFNYLGKKIFSESGHTQKIDLSSAGDGIYFYYITTNSGT
jgi:hypothetical protein